MDARFKLIAIEDSEGMSVDGITIDAPTSMDLDDAVWLDDTDAAMRVTICIADVARGIHMDTARDLQARERGFTRYYARGSAPMLPSFLGEDRLSLLPGKSRHVLCIRIALDAALAATEIAVFSARIKVAARLSHADVRSVLHNAPGPDVHSSLRPMLERMAALAARLLEARRKRGELALYDLQTGWTLTEEGALRRLKREERHIGYIVVQELMILANRSMAEILVQADAPTLFRNHTARAAAPDRDSLIADIQAAISHPDMFDLETLERRMHLLLSRARYGPDLHGHFGLNLPAYLHFTSPIRRYADLVNHRVVSALLQGKPLPYTRADLIEVGNHLNDLIDEEMERVSLAHKQRAAAIAAKLVDAEPEQIANLPDKQAFQVLEASLAKGPPPERLVEGMEARLASDSVSVKEIYFLLFLSPQEGEEWARLRGATVIWLNSRPFHAISLIFIGSQAGAWANPNYEYIQEHGRFRCTVSVTRGTERPESSTQTGSNKKTAQQRAALALCCRLLGIPHPTATYPAATPMVSSEARPAPPKVTRPEKRRIEAFRHAREMTEPGDWVSALWNVLTAYSLKKPRIVNRPVHIEGATNVHCKMTVTWAGQTLEADATAPTGTQAKQQTAREILEGLLRLQDAEIEPSVSPVNQASTS